jgi:hypothetical protein
MNSKAVLRQLAIDELIVQSIGDFLRQNFSALFFWCACHEVHHHRPSRVAAASLRGSSSNIALDLDRAQEAFDAAVKLNPSNTIARNGLTDILKNKRRVSQHRRSL